MAFATSNPELLSGGNCFTLVGDWTGTVGDAAGTVTGSGYCLEAVFMPNTSTSPSSVIPCRFTNSSGTWTVTVPYVETVTAGRYSIKYR